MTTSNEVDEAQIKKEMDGETYIEKCLKEKEKSVWTEFWTTFKQTHTHTQKFIKSFDYPELTTLEKEKILKKE